MLTIDVKYSWQFNMFLLRTSKSLDMLKVTRSMCSQVPKLKLPIPVFDVEGKYVTALYRAASQMKQIDQVEKHLRDIRNELSKPGVKDFIESSTLSRAQKAKVLQEVGQKAGMPPAAINFLAVVAENGRLNMLRQIINLFLEVMVAHRNEALCEVTTAQPLDDNSRNLIMKALAKFVQPDKKIKLTERVDPSIIGGIKVGIEDKHIDMSISRKLQVYSDLLRQSI